jgi:hypothetical protein
MEVNQMLHSTQFKMMVEGFMEHAKTQDQSLVNGAVMAFIPHEGDASSVSILSWVPDPEKADPATVWQEAFIAMTWTLMASGLTVDDIHGAIDYAASFFDSMSVETGGIAEEVEN